MDTFVRRLVQRLLDPARPLSRNRHFATFSSPEGKLALRVARRLSSVQRDVEACWREDAEVEVTRENSERGGWRLELPLTRLRSLRSLWLSNDELDLLRLLPGMDALGVPQRLAKPG